MDIAASIENMDDLSASLGACLEMAESCVDEVFSALERLSDNASAELTSATQAMEEAEDHVLECENQVDSLESSLFLKK